AGKEDGLASPAQLVRQRGDATAPERDGLDREPTTLGEVVLGEQPGAGRTSGLDPLQTGFRGHDLAAAVPNECCQPCGRLVVSGSQENRGELSPLPPQHSQPRPQQL